MDPSYSSQKTSSYSNQTPQPQPNQPISQPPPPNPPPLFPSTPQPIQPPSQNLQQQYSQNQYQVNQEQTTIPPKKHSVFKIVLLIIILLILGVAGFGFYNGYQIKKYAEKRKSSMIESNSIWTYQQIDTMFDFDKKWSDESLKLLGNEVYDNRDIIREMKADCDSQLNILEGNKAPAKDEQLKQKSVEYFTIGKDFSTQAEKYFDYYVLMWEVEKNMKAFRGLGDVYSEADFDKRINEVSLQIQNNIQQLKKANPPKIYMTFNNQIIEYLNDSNHILLLLNKAVQESDITLLLQTLNKMDEASKKFDAIHPPKDLDVINVIITAENKKKLKEYPNQIRLESDKMASSIISY